MEMLDNIKLQYEQPERFDYCNMEIVQRYMGFGSNQPSSEIVVKDNQKGSLKKPMSSRASKVFAKHTLKNQSMLLKDKKSSRYDR